MAYETKVILRMLANQVARAESLEEAYVLIAEAACVDGLELPSYEEAREKFKRFSEKNKS